MAVDFSAFDAKVDDKALADEVKKAKTYEDVPAGVYDVSFDKMEIKPTKKGDKLMLAVQMNIISDDNKGRKIFFNKVIYGNSSQNYPDARAIHDACSWLDKLQTETVPEFVSYSDFADCVTDIFQELDGVGATIDYKPDAFNSVEIKDTFDI